jgi:LacI family repressor for deo operon, udp, cdd, tsx, nupC, and nupG
MELLEKIHAEGLIITNHVPTSILTKLNDTLPLVQCCEYDSTLPIPYVSIDDIAATRSAMEYLISLGRRNIALINGPIRYKYARQRLQGYLESLEKAGIKEDPDLILQLPDVNYDVASSAIKELMLAHKRPDAFFCVSDAYAAAVIKSCTKMGLRVPQDVMVVGFDNIDIAAMLSPTITTINQPKYQLGFSSCELLIELINNPNPSVRSILMETELIVRESTTL